MEPKQYCGNCSKACRSCRLDCGEGSQHRESVLKKIFDEIQELETDKINLVAVPALKRIVAYADEYKQCCKEVVAENNVHSENELVSVSDPQLPVEIWAKVFENLHFEDLCHARMVGSQWKEILDRFSMSKFILNIHTPMMILSDHKPVPMVPASTIRFKLGAIEAIGSWWAPSITEMLVNIEFECCNISDKILLTMLRHTPSLVSLIFGRRSTLRRDGDLSEFSELQLEKMTNLTLNCVDQDVGLKVFSRTFPRLKNFELSSDYHQCHRGVLNMIETLPSLEGISLVSSSINLFHLVGVDHQFKRASITLTDAWFNENLIRFSLNQPFLECLDLQIEGELTSRDLRRVTQHLPKLKRLSLTLSFGNTDINMQSMRSLAELEYLSLRRIVMIDRGSLFPPSRLLTIPFVYEPLPFAGVRHLKLKEIYLQSINFESNSSELREYIANAPNLRAITLEKCFFHSYSDLLTAIQSEGLRHLKLVEIRVPELNDDGLNISLNGLRYLELRDCALMTEQLLLSLFGSCTGLEELHLSDLNNVCDAVVLFVCQKMKQLRKLTISKCPIMDASIRHIKEHALMLEQLTINGCDKLTTKGIIQLHGTNIELLKIKLKLSMW